MVDTSLSTSLLLWVVVLAALGFGRWWRKAPGTGLVLVYALNLWTIHWVAPALYVLPWYEGFDRTVVEAGLRQSLYGIVAFAFASVVLTPFLLKRGLLRRSARLAGCDARLPKAYVAIGVGSYVLMSLGIGALPSAAAVFSAGQQLVVAGLALCCWQAWRDGSVRQMIPWLAITCSLPFVTILAQGFIGFGAIAALTVLVFVSGFIRTRLVVLVFGGCFAYLLLSVFVTYMRDRTQIRETVWGGQPVQARMDQLQKTFSSFEWFDVSKSEHLRITDGRLNQDFLVGLAVTRLQDSGDYAYGETLWQALLALVPRAIWPEKPIQAGSGNVVSHYTGLTFAPGTSVGIGHVMEFFLNFGSIGVWIGFAVIGILVTGLDAAAAECLRMNDLQGFVLRYLPGLSLLQVGGSLIEVTASAAASIFVAVIANAYLRRLRTREALQGRTPPARMVPWNA